MSDPKISTKLAGQVWRDMRDAARSNADETAVNEILDRVEHDPEALRILATYAKNALKALSLKRGSKQQRGEGTDEVDERMDEVKEFINHMKTWQTKKVEQAKANFEEAKAIAELRNALLKGWADLFAENLEASGYIAERFLTSSGEFTKLHHQGFAALAAGTCERSV